MARRSRGFVQLEWICPNCSTRNPGPKKSCINCGAPQPENVQFQRAGDERLVRDDESLRAAQAGADFICPYCGTRNNALSKVCVQCGGDLAEARRRIAGGELNAYSGPKQVTCANCGTENPVNNANCSKCGSPLPRVTTSPPSSARVVAGTSPKKKPSRWWLWAGIAALVVLCVGVLVAFAVPTASLDATVVDVRWQTSVPVQEIGAVRHTHESGSPPSGAYDVSCQDESNEVCTERVIDQGNGFGEVVEDCRTETERYCSYTVDEWKTIQTYTLQGADLSPVYSQPSVSSGQRLGDASSDFTIFFNTVDGQKKYTTSDLSEFSQFYPGSSWTLKLNAVGGVLDVVP